MAKKDSGPSWLDRAIAYVSPRTAYTRARYAAALSIVEQHRGGGRRHYEAASVGRRTETWSKLGTDQNIAARGQLAALRNVARDLVRNNGWARRALAASTNNTVGWGIMAKPVSSKKMVLKYAKELWKAWANSTACDFDGRLTFYGMQRLVMRTCVEAGEVLVRRHRWKPGADPALAIPIKLQILEPDFIDTSRDGINGDNQNRMIQGVEYDASGQRVAYWLFQNHPGAAQVQITSRLVFHSVRVPAEDILHIFRTERAGQVRGVTAFAPAIVKLKDFDEFEDAQLMRQKIAACFTAFTTDPDGDNTPLTPVKDGDTPDAPEVEQFEPGMIVNLPGGRTIEFGNPPLVQDDGFTKRTLAACAAGIGVTYEQMTGDYSNVNFSSARMARIEFFQSVHEWRWDVIVPQFCAPAYAWVMQQAFIAGEIGEVPLSDWTPPPMAMIEPDKEGLALQRMVRGGFKTPDDAVREQGFDPEDFWVEYAANLKRLDELGIVVDSDARRVTQNGQQQGSSGGAGGGDNNATGDATANNDNAAQRQFDFGPGVTEVRLDKTKDGIVTGWIGDQSFELTRNPLSGALRATLKN